MRKARINIHNHEAGILQENEDGSYEFNYDDGYTGPSISLTMPIQRRTYVYDRFPPFFDGLLPEGIQLEGLLRSNKLDSKDFFGQLLAIGQDTVGAVTIHEMTP